MLRLEKELAHNLIPCENSIKKSVDCLTLQAAVTGSRVVGAYAHGVLACQAQCGPLTLCGLNATVVITACFISLQSPQQLADATLGTLIVLSPLKCEPLGGRDFVYFVHLSIPSPPATPGTDRWLIKMSNEYTNPVV